MSDALHVRYSIDWWLAERGISPLGRARNLRSMAGNSEKHLATELGAYTATLVPLPLDGDAYDEAREALKAGPGKTHFVRSMKGVQHGAEQRSDWDAKKLQPKVTEGNLGAYQAIERSVWRACGVPVGLFEATEGREAFRQFIHLALEPLGDLLESEAAEAGLRITVSFDRLRGSDLANRARSFKSLYETAVANGDMDVEDALAITGLLLDEA